MGVRGGKDFFSAKWVTAEISDEQNRLWLHPIKNEIDGYFIATINKQNYVFKIDHSRIKIWYATLTQSFRILHYTTSHYMPISDQDCKALEQMIIDNGLPKLDKMLFHILEKLGIREKPDFKEHDLNDLISEIKTRKDQNAVLLRNMKTYLDDMNTKKIITPVKPITEFIHKDLIATDPRWVDSVGEAEVKADIENRKINNEPIGTKRAWMKPMLIMAMIGVGALIGVLIWQNGTFDGILPDFSQIKPLSLTPPGAGDNLMSRYPDPVDLRLACDRGEVNCDSLPQNVKDMLKNVKLPTATPSNQVVNLTP